MKRGVDFCLLPAVLDNALLDGETVDSLFEGVTLLDWTGEGFPFAEVTSDTLNRLWSFNFQRPPAMSRFNDLVLQVVNILKFTPSTHWRKAEKVSLLLMLRNVSLRVKAACPLAFTSSFDSSKIRFVAGLSVVNAYKDLSAMDVVTSETSRAQARATEQLVALKKQRDTMAKAAKAKEEARVREAAKVKRSRSDEVANPLYVDGWLYECAIDALEAWNLLEKKKAAEAQALSDITAAKAAQLYEKKRANPFEVRDETIAVRPNKVRRTERGHEFMTGEIPMTYAEFFESKHPSHGVARPLLFGPGAKGFVIGQSVPTLKKISQSLEHMTREKPLSVLHQGFAAACSIRFDISPYLMNDEGSTSELVTGVRLLGEILEALHNSVLKSRCDTFADSLSRSHSHMGFNMLKEYVNVVVQNFFVDIHAILESIQRPPLGTATDILSFWRETLPILGRPINLKGQVDVGRALLVGSNEKVIQKVVTNMLAQVGVASGGRRNGGKKTPLITGGIKGAYLQIKDQKKKFGFPVNNWGDTVIPANVPLSTTPNTAKPGQYLSLCVRWSLLQLTQVGSICPMDPGCRYSHQRRLTEAELAACLKFK